MQRDHIFTSESVTEGHPDKLADQISDAVLDAHLREDPQARVACETLLKDRLIVIAGEVRSRASVNAPRIARKVFEEVGYTDESLGFSLADCAVYDHLSAQSADIAQGVDESDGHEQGAGDQGMMFGFACDDTPELMPAPIAWAHRLAEALAQARHRQPDSPLRPDGKVQVSVAYENGKPARIDTLLMSTQHDDGIEQGELAAWLGAHVIDKAVQSLADARGQSALQVRRLLINPTGRFVTGGPLGDAGLTGRKIIVDTYGGMGRHGGGAFSGKDASKVDRSAAYFARYIAKNVVAAGLARRCEVQLAYAIGVAAPVSLMVDTFHTACCDELAIERAARDVFDARPAAISRRLELLGPRYQPTATYGHFGRPAAVASWERTDAAEALRQRCLPAIRKDTAKAPAFGRL